MRLCDMTEEEKHQMRLRIRALSAHFNRTVPPPPVRGDYPRSPVIEATAAEIHEPISAALPPPANEDWEDIIL